MGKRETMQNDGVREGHKSKTWVVGGDRRTNKREGTCLNIYWCGRQQATAVRGKRRLWAPRATDRTEKLLALPATDRERANRGPAKQYY